MAFAWLCMILKTGKQKAHVWICVWVCVCPWSSQHDDTQYTWGSVIVYVVIVGGCTLWLNLLYSDQENNYLAVTWFAAFEGIVYLCLVSECDFSALNSVRHCRFALFSRRFTVQGFAPRAAEADRVLLNTYAHPVLLTLRLPAFLFLCHIHLAQPVVLESHLSCKSSHTCTQRQHTHEQGFYLINSVRCSLALYKPQLMYPCSCYMCIAKIMSKLAPRCSCLTLVVSCVMLYLLCLT